MQVLVRTFEKFCLVAELKEVTELLYRHVSLRKIARHHKTELHMSNRFFIKRKCITLKYACSCVVGMKHIDLEYRPCAASHTANHDGLG
jgi:hypothetical protein